MWCCIRYTCCSLHGSNSCCIAGSGLLWPVSMRECFKSSGCSCTFASSRSTYTLFKLAASPLDQHVAGLCVGVGVSQLLATACMLSCCALTYSVRCVGCIPVLCTRPVLELSVPTPGGFEGVQHMYVPYASVQLCCHHEPGHHEKACVTNMFGTCVRVLAAQCHRLAGSRHALRQD
jgi:hypothetical protein